MSPNRILLIDDEQHIVDVVVYVLEESGYDVTVALDGDKGLTQFEQRAPDLVLLDLNLPGIGGLDLFHQMRRIRPDVPIIMLTSRSEELDRIVGLEMGADDYVTKPFSPRELAARVRAVLRRTREPAGRTPDATLLHGPIKVDPVAYNLTFFDRPVDVTRPEFRLIELLVRYPARVFTRDMLMSAVYDDDTVVGERSVDAYVKRLRKKFAAIEPSVNPVETVYGLGYKLNQALETTT